MPDNTVVKTIEVPTVGIEVMMIQPKIPDWAADIIKYLETDEMPEDRQEARKIRNRGARYTMIEGVLYQQEPFGRTGTSQKSDESGLLLAASSPGCQKLCSEV